MTEFMHDAGVRVVWVLAAASLVAGALDAWATLRERRRYQRSVYGTPRPRTSGLRRRRQTERGRTLVVLVHGWRRGWSVWTRFLTLMGSDPAFDDADVYAFNYRPSWWLRLRLDDQGEALATELDVAAGERGPYDRYILVGYSIGGLIVRSALLKGLDARHAWAANVTRVVLLATPNRGLGGRESSFAKRVSVALMRLGSPTFPRDALRGSDFMTRLRLDWVRLFKANVRNIGVVQILGTHDELIGRDDSNDVVVFPHSKLRMVGGAHHGGLADARTHGDQRYEIFRAACLSPIASMRGDEGEPLHRPSAVLFQLHGIRDHGHWLTHFERTIRQLDGGIRVVRPGYGYFSALNFVLPWSRRRRIAWFCDCYTEEVARLGTGDDVPFYFVGHSYGTYLLGQCLERFPQMQFDRVCLVGSVLPQDWKWRNHVGPARQIKALRNDCASHDWPVAICCRLLNAVFRFADLGTGGFRGFSAGIPEVENRMWIPGGHSAGLTNDTHRATIANFLFARPVQDTALLPDPARWLSRASDWAVPLAVVTTTAIGGALMLLATALALPMWVPAAVGGALVLALLSYV